VIQLELGRVTETTLSVCVHHQRSDRPRLVCVFFVKEKVRNGEQRSCTHTHICMLCVHEGILCQRELSFFTRVCVCLCLGRSVMAADSVYPKVKRRIEHLLGQLHGVCVCMCVCVCVCVCDFPCVFSLCILCVFLVCFPTCVCI